MLEKLVQLESDQKYMDTLDYWFAELQETSDVYELRPLVKLIQMNNDSYMDFVLSLNKSDNMNFQVIKLLAENQNRMGEMFKNASNTIAEEFVKKSPFFVLELVKMCSRLFKFEVGKDCSELRKMILDDDSYTTEHNTIIALSTVKSSDNLMEADDTELFWDRMDRLVQGSENQDAVCGSWVAAKNEDVISRHFLLNFRNEFSSDMSFNSTLKELCKTCSSVCGLSSQIYSEWYIEVYKMNPVVDAIYSAGLLLSVIFLLLTLLVFFLLPYLHRPLHAKYTISHLVSMVTAYSSLAIPQLIQNLFLNYRLFCIINGYIMQFCFLSMFFWLNVMCFDILLAFSFLTKKKTRRKESKGERSKLYWYSWYGWGGPTLILCLTLFIQYSEVLDFYYIPEPDVGGPKCFFQSRGSQWLYLYGPVGCLIIANLIMFTITAFMIYKHSKTSSVLKSSENASFNKRNSSRLKVYVNLFVLMGANWAAEVLNWTFPNKEIINYVFDVTTTLQGVLVFILLVCKPRIIRDLKKKLTCKSRVNNNQTSLSSNRSSKTMAETPC